jgi:hypothetical protein
METQILWLERETFLGLEPTKMFYRWTLRVDTSHLSLVIQNLLVGLKMKDLGFHLLLIMLSQVQVPIITPGIQEIQFNL